MKRQDLRSISNLEQLEAARKEVSKEIRLKEKAMGKDVDRVKGLFKPVRLLGAGWEIMAPQARPLDRILLGLVHRAKNFVKKI